MSHSTANIRLIDPRRAHPAPPFPEQTQEMPGKTFVMNPKPDHGEDSYVGSGKLEGLKALVTGADSGIGRAVALAFAREGADVAIAYLQSHDDAHLTAELVEGAGREALLCPGDLGQAEHCRKVVDDVVAEFGQIDILVNNAAYQMAHDKFAECTPEEIEYTFRSNVFSAFFLTQASMPHMPPGGSIINTTSIQAYQPSSPLIPYAATKAAIADFTKSLAQEAIESGIRVNAVAPGPVWTPLIPGSFEAEKVKDFGKDTLFGRPAQPAELAPVYVLLASPEASFITGMIYGITGGKPIS